MLKIDPELRHPSRLKRKVLIGLTPGSSIIRTIMYHRNPVHRENPGLADYIGAVSVDLIKLSMIMTPVYLVHAYLTHGS